MLTEQSFSGPRGFARASLAHGIPWQPRTGLKWGFQGVGECILYRHGCWQIELMMLPPGNLIPRHRHRRVSSADLCLGGDDALCIIGGIERDNAMHGGVDANLLLLPKDVWHEGHSGEQGAVFLSFQQWTGPPGFIMDDWEQSNDHPQ